MRKIVDKLKFKDEYANFEMAQKYVDWWFDDYEIKNPEDKQYMTWMNSEIPIKKFLSTF